MQNRLTEASNALEPTARCLVVSRAAAQRERQPDMRIQPTRLEDEGFLADEVVGVVATIRERHSPQFLELTGLLGACLDILGEDA